jgi:hypothetical protein
VCVRAVNRRAQVERRGRSRELGGTAADAPAARPLRAFTRESLYARFADALAARDGVAGAHCVHELWLRDEIGANVERALRQLWAHAGPTIPDWLPMRHFDWLRLAYEVAARFPRPPRGRTNVYLVLLDYEDARPERYGVYVGATGYSPAQRFDQHKAGIRAAGSVLRRGVEVLTGPVMHLQGIRRADAEAIEEGLAEALRAAGLHVKGGH